jgi:hypothetical protein
LLPKNYFKIKTLFSTKKREKEEGSFKGLSTGYNIFIILFIASMLCFAVRRTLDGTHGKILSPKICMDRKNAHFHNCPIFN